MIQRASSKKLAMAMLYGDCPLVKVELGKYSGITVSEATSNFVARGFAIGSVVASQGQPFFYPFETSTGTRFRLALRLTVSTPEIRRSFPVPIKDMFFYKPLKTAVI